MSNPHRAVAYPTEEQYERWAAEAEERGYKSVSQFIQDMTEAGLKKFEATTEPDVTNDELREQRNDLKDELSHARTRVEELEEQLYRGERETVRRYIERNPGAAYEEVLEQVRDTAPVRLTQTLEELEGDGLHISDDGSIFFLSVDKPVDDPHPEGGGWYL